MDAVTAKDLLERADAVRAVREQLRLKADALVDPSTGISPLSDDVDAHGVGRDRAKRLLRSLSSSPVLDLLVEEISQSLVADGVTSDAGGDSARLWEPWERSGLPSIQAALWRAAVLYGQAYLWLRRDGLGMAVMEPLDDSRVTAVYDSPTDEAAALAVRPLPGDRVELWTPDEYAVVAVTNGGIAVETTDENLLGLVPVVRCVPRPTLSGEPEGDAERFRAPLLRHEKTTHDRLLTQHYNSWKIITATGLDDPGSEDARAKSKLKLGNDDVLTGGEGVSFGTLDETPLDGFLAAEQRDLTTLAAMARVPVWTVAGGQLVNLSADAIAEARASELRRVQSTQRSLGRSICQALRLAAMIEGRADDAADYTLHVQWLDTEARSLSQAADALGKIASQLGVPQQLLWEMIPGVTRIEADQWRAYADEHPSLDAALLQHVVAEHPDGSDA